MGETLRNGNIRCGEGKERTQEQIGRNFRFTDENA